MRPYTFICKRGHFCEGDPCTFVPVFADPKEPSNVCGMPAQKVDVGTRSVIYKRRPDGSWEEHEVPPGPSIWSSEP